MDEGEDIFEKASKQSIELIKKPEENPSKIEVVVGNENEQLAIEHSAEGSKWDNLAKYIDGDGADRLLKELKAMSGKDYVRNYFKALEHFRPKLTRVESKPVDQVDKQINVTLYKQKDNGEVELINLNL